MNTVMLARSSIAGACAATAVLVAACASVPSGGERFAGVPPGTVLTFSRTSTGSFGTAGGEVVWTYAEATWAGRKVLDARNSAGGGTLHDPATFGIIANLNAAGQPTMSYEPPIALAWPLEVGKAWTSKHTVTLYPSGQKVPFENTWKIEAYETVTVPAGTFPTFRTVRTGSDGEVETRWVGTTVALPLVKRVMTRAPTHRLGEGSQTAALVSVKLPGQ